MIPPDAQGKISIFQTMGNKTKKDLNNFNRYDSLYDNKEVPRIRKNSIRRNWRTGWMPTGYPVPGGEPMEES